MVVKYSELNKSVSFIPPESIEGTTEYLLDLLIAFLNEGFLSYKILHVKYEIHDMS